MTIRVTYENTETGQTETAELPDNDWIVLCGRSSTIAEAMWHGISRRNGIMRGFRVDELTNAAFDGLCDAPLLFQPITEVQREEAHMATLKASLLFADYVSHALFALPESRRAEARRLAVELGLVES